MNRAGKRLVAAGLALLFLLTCTWQLALAEDSPLRNSLGNSLGHSLGGSGPTADEPGEDPALPMAMPVSSPPLIEVPAQLAPVPAPNLNLMRAVEMTSIEALLDDDTFYITETMRIIFYLEADSGITAGSQTTLLLPSNLKIINTPDFFLYNEDGSNRAIATARVDAGSNAVVLTFNSNAAAASSITGHLRISAELNGSEIKEDRANEPFPFWENSRHQKTLYKTIKYRDTASSYHMFFKGGKRGDNLEMNWYTNLNYYSKYTPDSSGLPRDVKNVTITDTVEDGHVLIPESITVNRYSWIAIPVNGLGNGFQHSYPPYDVTHSDGVKIEADSKGFTITIDDLQSQPHGISYTTVPTDFSRETFYNSSTFTAQVNGASYSRDSRNYISFSFGGSLTPNYQDKIFKVIKKDADTGALLPGAVFELYNNEDNLVTTLTTGDDGAAVYSALMGEGDEYRLVEIQPPGSEYLLPEEPVTFVVPNDKTSFEVVVPNKKAVKTGILELRKVDSEGFRLSGAAFMLYYDQELTQMVVDRNGNSMRVTGADGQQPGHARIEGIPYGTYYLAEVEAPLGYKLPKEPYIEVEVGDSPNGVTVVTLSNERDEIPITILKEDAQTGERLSGARFTAYRKAPVTGNWTQVMEFAVPGPDGFTSKAVEGEYRLWEDAAPDGYLLPNRYIEFEITKRDMDIGRKIVTVTNNPRPDNAVLTSVQAYTHDEKDWDRALGAPSCSFRRRTPTAAGRRSPGCSPGTKV